MERRLQGDCLCGSVDASVAVSIADFLLRNSSSLCDRSDLRGGAANPYGGKHCTCTGAAKITANGCNCVTIASAAKMPGVSQASFFDELKGTLEPDIKQWMVHQ